MAQPEIYQAIETQLSMLDEREQENVLAYIRSLLEHKQEMPPSNPQHRQQKGRSNIQNLRRLMNAGKSDVSDGAEEHDHYVYGTSKKKKQ